MAIKDLVGTEWVDGDILYSADLSDTLNTKLSTNYSSAARKTVLEGLTMTGTGAQTINVAAGYYVGSDGKARYSAGNATFALSAAEGATNYRYDLITINDAGTITETTGTPSATAPVIPSVPADHTILGYVFRDINDNTTSTNDVGDMRTLWSPVMDKIFSMDMTAFTFTDAGAMLPGGCRCWFPTAYPNTYNHFRMRITARDPDSKSFGLTQNWNVGATNDYSYGAVTLDMVDVDPDSLPLARWAGENNISRIHLSLITATGDLGQLDGEIWFPYDGSNYGMQVIFNRDSNASSPFIDGTTIMTGGNMEDTNASPSTSVQFSLGSNTDHFTIEIWGYK